MILLHLFIISWIDFSSRSPLAFAILLIENDVSAELFPVLREATAMKIYKQNIQLSSMPFN